MVEFLLTEGANVNAKNIDGQTPLLAAAEHGSKAIVEFLLAKRADSDVKAKGKDGETPLHRAAFLGHKNLADGC
jgi:ankyrin repeat protein